jgi:hypothetical protein
MSASEPVINEFMASNTSGILDEDNLKSDWIEIYNPSSQPLDLAGWHLTDDKALPHAFTFPSPTVLNPGGYLLVIASGENRALSGSELHANFKLDANGEYLGLLRPDDSPATEFDPFPAQIANIAYGFSSATTTSTLPLTSASAARYLVPNGSLGSAWTSADFDDSSWSSGTNGIGFSPPGNAPLPRELEPNNATSSANSALFNFAPSSGNLYQLGLSGVASVSTGVINDDWFKIGKLDPGDVLSVAGAGSPGGRAGGSTNLSVELWRTGSATAVITDADSGPGLDALINRFAISTADTYYVRIRAQTTTTLTGNYQLGLWLENSGINPLTSGSLNTETEANDTLATANDASTSWQKAQYLSRTSGTITSGDLDTYQFLLNAGDLLTINADSTSVLDARVSLLGPGGTVIASEDGTSTGPAADSTIDAFRIPANGMYYVQVSAAAGSGDYNADVYLSSTNSTPPLSSLSSLINTDINSQMRNVNPTAYIRIPFSTPDTSAVGTMLLRMKYNDGFIAYLNGTEIAQRNAPPSPEYDSTATASRSAADSSVFETIDISQFISLLDDTNPNVLAIQGLNSSAAGDTFLILPEILTYNFLPGPLQYMTTPTPGKANLPGALGAVEDTTFSVDRGFYDSPFPLVISSDTTDAQIRYTLDGSAPTATTGFVYNGPINIGPQLYGTPGGPAKPGVIIVRAAAFKTGWIPTNVDSQTYIFLDSVIRQDASGLPLTWGGTGSGNTIMTPPGPDYALDQTVVNANIGVIKNSLKSLPTVSLSMPLNDWFGASGQGIYPAGIGNAKAMSMEYIDPAGGDGFQVNGSVQITGGGEGGTSAQRWKTYKLSMRVKFKEALGDSSLDFPLYGANAADSFDTLILDAQINNTWLHPAVAQQVDAMLIQDQFVSDLQTAMSGTGTGPHGKFVHLYINGLYWGVYDLHERPDEHFAEAYYGGDDPDWDVISHTKANASNNDALAVNDFQNLLNRVSADMTNPANYAAVQQVLDIDDFCDYILANFYAGNMDWSAKNWYATFNRNDPAGRWRFHSWDAEHVFESAQGGVLSATADITGISQPDSPTAIYQKLLLNPEFKLRFADHVQKHFFNGGALTPAATSAMYQARMNEVDAPNASAMIAESARWGDNRRAGNSYTRANWFAYQQRLLSEYFPVRTNNVVNQLRTRGVFPSLAAPNFSSYGGTFAGPVNLTITNPGAGIIYYTIDGSDPRLVGGALNPAAIAYSGAINLSNSTNIRARVLNGTIWSPIIDAKFIIGPPPAVRVSEVMYHSRNPDAASPYIADQFDYIELLNTSAAAINLNNINFTRGITFTFPNMTLPAGARTLLVANQAAFESRYGVGLPIAGVFTGSLSDSGEKIRLETGLGQEIEEFTYNDNWYPQTDGDGFSLVAIDPTASDIVLSGKDGWRPSEPMDGGPGASDPGINPGAVVINELLARGLAPSSDWIEFFNTTNSPIDISGWALSDNSANLTKYILQPGSIVPAHGYLVLDESATFGQSGNPGVNLQFDFSKSGDQAYLTQRVAGNLAGYRESVDFGASDVDVPFGRYIKSNGTKDFVPMSAPSKGGPNSYPRVGPIIINEVMVQPQSGGIEYIELKNISNNDISLVDASLNSPWKFTAGITFSFGASDVIPAGGYALVVATTPAAFRATYNIPANVPVFGPFAGQLDNSGEKIELGKPTNFETGTNLPKWVTVDRLSYNNAAPWPAVNANGSALWRSMLTDYTNDSANWLASPVGGSPGAPNPRTLTGQSTADSYYLRVGPSNITQLYRNDPTFSGPPEFTFPGNGLDQLVINAGAGNDSLTIDLPTGLGLPSAGIIFNGDVGDDTITIPSLTAAANPVQINTGTGINTLNFANGQTINSLTVPATGQLNLPAGGKVLKLKSLSITGTLNITDNDLILQSDAANWQSVLNSIAALLAAGRSGGAWNGNGINSATAAANANRATGIAVIANRTSAGAALYTNFDGQPVDQNSILIKYTYNGDANADGLLNADDYAAIDAGFATGATGYANGDFNYSGGPPNSDDYFAIDLAFANQDAPLAPAPQAASAQSVKAQGLRSVRVGKHHHHSRKFKIRLTSLFLRQF